VDLNHRPLGPEPTAHLENFANKRPISTAA